MTTANALVYCVACIDGGEIKVVHIFSDAAKRKAWADSAAGERFMRFVHYDYVVDQPERMEQPTQ